LLGEVRFGKRKEGRGVFWILEEDSFLSG